MNKLKSSRLLCAAGTGWKRLFGIVAIGLMIMSMVAVPAAIAEENETAEPTPAPVETGNENEETPPPLYDTFMNKLAANLGVTTDKLQSAIAQTEQEMVQEGVENGILPEEKAEDMQAYIQENGNLRGYGLSVAQQRIQERLQQAVEEGIIDEDKAEEIEQRFQQVREKVMERIQNRPGLREGWEDFRSGQSGQVWDRLRSLWEERIQDRLRDRLSDISIGSGTETMDVDDSGTGTMDVELPELTPELPELPGTASDSQDENGAGGP